MASLPIVFNADAQPALLIRAAPSSGPVHEQVGYKEGLEEGKAKTLQQGFDEGEGQTFRLSVAHELRYQAGLSCSASTWPSPHSVPCRISHHAKTSLLETCGHLRLCFHPTGFRTGAQRGYQEGISRGLEVTREALAQLTAKAAVRDKQ